MFSVDFELKRLRRVTGVFCVWFEVKSPSGKRAGEIYEVMQRNIRNDKKEPGIQGNAVQQPVKYDESQFGFDI